MTGMPSTTAPARGPWPCANPSALALARTEVTAAIGRLNAAGTDAASSEQRKVRSELITRFGARSATAILLTRKFEHDYLRRLTDTVGAAGTAHVLAALHDAVAATLTGEDG